MIHLYDEAVGGDGGVGEVGRGLLEQEVGLVVAGADVGEQQLFGLRLGGELASLAGGEVLALAGEVGEVVGEGALQTQEVGALHVGHEALVVFRVAAVGVDPWGAESGERRVESA